MASSIPSPFEMYPFPLGIKVRDIISFKLSKQNVVTWTPLMVGLIKSQGLIGFVNGEVPAPPKRVTVADEGSPNGTMEIDNPYHEAWERTDALLRSWILGTVDEDLLPSLVSLQTVRDMWTTLDTVLTTSQLETNMVPNTEAPVVKNDNLCKYLPLYRAAITDDWKSAEEFLKNEPDAVRTVITGSLETAVVVAIRSEKGNQFVKKLLKDMSKDDVALPDEDGCTALHYAAICGNMEAAKLLVEKNPDLPNMADNSKLLPIHHASIFGRRSMVLYLLGLTNKDMEPKLLEDQRGATLINGLIASNQFDIAILMIKRYPELACIQSSPALNRIALKRSAFPSGAHFNFWQSLIYSYVPPKLEDSAYQSSGGDIENPVNSAVSFRAYVKQKLRHIFWQLTEMLVPQMKKIQEKKRVHHQAHQLVELLCKKVVKLEYSKAKEIFQTSVMIAAKVGIPEVIEEIFAAFPDVIYARNLKGEHVFHIAILNRHENIFNLIYQLRREVRHLVLAIPDFLDKSSLDLVACLKDEQRVNLRANAAGAALQMQRELQWYKEVEKFSLDYHKDNRDLEREVPRKEFSKTHEKLIKEGEEWMKDTANSCTIVAALIVTIVFAAAITVPGGNSGDNGHPIFSNDKVFLIFGLSDALALFSSTSSLLVFLSILTSRYGEEDFLKVLPRRLITGLVTLFISIISMMIAFGATLYLVFGDKKPWIFAPITVLSCIPAALFVSSQFPLLLDMIKSTYGTGLFYSQNDRILL